MFVHCKRRVPHNLIGQYPAHIKHMCKRKKQYWRQRETLGYSKCRKAIQTFILNVYQNCYRSKVV